MEETLNLIDRSELTNRWLLVRRCVNKANECREIDGRMCYLADGIILPDMTADDTYFSSIQKVATDCIHFSEDDIGKLVITPELSHDYFAIDEKMEWWFAREKVLEKVLIEL